MVLGAREPLSNGSAPAKLRPTHAPPALPRAGEEDGTPARRSMKAKAPRGEGRLSERSPLATDGLADLAESPQTARG
jgi:hypothetical protein